MAAIEKIRRRSGLLVAIIGIALLVFVLEDLIQSRGGGRVPVAAVVGGEKISQIDFNQQHEKELRKAERDKMYYTQDENATLTNSERIMVYNNTLDKMISEIIMNEEYKAAGLDITSEELYDQLTGATTGKPYSMMAQYFPDGNGGVDKAKVDEYIQNLSELPAEYYNQWIEMEQDIKKDRLSNKFNNLVRASYFVPAPLAQKYYEKSAVKVSADIIAVHYGNIADSLVTITDADNKAYYDAHKEEFKSEEMRDIEYVIFDVKPLEEDRNRARDAIMSKREAFAGAENVDKFLYAKGQKYDSTWLGRKQVPQQIEQSVFDSGRGVGFVTEMFDNGNEFKMARIMDMQPRYDSLMASHILIPFKGCPQTQDTISKEDAEAKANALLAQLKNNPKDEELFANLAKENSSDGSKDKGGDLGWFKDGQMVPEFNEFVQKNDVNYMGVVESRFGFHIIKVTGKADLQPKVRLAFLSEPINASDNTKQLRYQEAKKFFADCKTYEQFNKSVEDLGYTKRTMQKMSKGTGEIPGVGVAREIVRWAFNDGKKGDVQYFDFLNDEKNMVVVAALTGIVKEGEYAPLDVVASQEKYKIINKKKGELAVEKMKACGNNLDKLKSELKVETFPVKDLSFDSKSLSNFGGEEAIIGIILGMKEGEEFGPIAGNGGAYIIKNVRIVQPEATNDYSSVLSKMTDSYNRKNVYAALKKLTKVKDNRTELF